VVSRPTATAFLRVSVTVRVSITERSRRRVADAIDRLESEYGDFEVVEKTWHHLPEAYETVRERFEAGTLGGAGCWTTDDDGRVLLVRHVGETAWSEPGGKHEADESLEVTARRETREEAGVEVELRGVRQAHHIMVRHGEDESRPASGGREPPLVHRLIVVFDAEHVSGEPRPREGEIAEVRWWEERPDDLLYDELAEFPIPAVE
jgi:ADP-ribose pyrophosphatase YjhB (NUDIX family)